MAPSTVTLASMSHDRLPAVPDAAVGHEVRGAAAAVPASRTTPNRAQSALMLLLQVGFEGFVGQAKRFRGRHVAGVDVLEGRHERVVDHAHGPRGRGRRADHQLVEEADSTSLSTMSASSYRSTWVGRV